MPFAAPDEDGRSEESGRDAAETILVVEDEVLIRLAIASFLRDCGYKVFEAASVDEARLVIEATAGLDLVFSDVNMPGEADGFALSAWVRERHPQVRVILTSGLSGGAAGEGSVRREPADREAVRSRHGAAARARPAAPSRACRRPLRSGFGGYSCSLKPAPTRAARLSTA